MNRLIAGTLGAAAVALAIGACDDGGHRDMGYGQGGANGFCQQYLSCGTCTPVVGCGWCATGAGGEGTCAADPDECATATKFYWTWEPTGCRSGPDAGVGPASDAGHDADTGTDAKDNADVSTDGDAPLD
jgi:hypothetical protein